MKTMKDHREEANTSVVIGSFVIAIILVAYLTLTFVYG